MRARVKRPSIEQFIRTEIIRHALVMEFFRFKIVDRYELKTTASLQSVPARQLIGQAELQRTEQKIPKTTLVSRCTAQRFVF